jgi:hypothetical protein
LGIIKGFASGSHAPAWKHVCDAPALTDPQRSGKARGLFSMTEGLWTKQGDTLSHNNACKEFGLAEREILEAIRTERLQYKVNYAHGNPYYKLLRKELLALTLELRGAGFLEKQEVEHKLQEVKRDMNSCYRKLKKLEKEQAALIEKLARLK